MFKSKPEVVNEYHDLIIECMKAIISNPAYEFRQEDKKKYYDGLTSSFKPEWKYELTILEAKRYADALMALDD
jgi:hypothetical protein